MFEKQPDLIQTNRELLKKETRLAFQQTPSLGELPGNKPATPRPADHLDDDQTSYRDSNLGNTARINLMIKKEEETENQ